MQWPLCTPCYFGFRPCFCPFRHWCLQDIEATKPMHLASWRERLRCDSYPPAHAASSVFFCTFGEHGSEADEHSADIRRRIDSGSPGDKMGRASGRERVCQYVDIMVVP